MENAEHTKNCLFLVKCGGAGVMEGTVRAVGHAGLRVAVSMFQVEREGSEKHYVKGLCTELLET